ncbi:hypothetical protein [Planococcus lenghuensis]|uniref:Uncharacterized protein n=1 Tax=Planococcus lenghuensis TaxID=2213202 RepID=A0A1Q2KZT0_9BACL|nr:hypothetical protein [Planococcus lenghuensis]AQQ53327.1 hypothetical protein B0X71_09710 [Planococcus lenghuensis]
MKRKWLLLLIAAPVLFVAGIVAFGWFMWVYEPVPNENEVEEMVGADDLTKFGEVEGSYLLTPRNYGYYDDEGIYIVKQYLDKGGEYGDQYVYIGEGMRLTDSDERAISQVEAKYAERLLQNHYENLHVISKHKMHVYRDDEKVEED